MRHITKYTILILKYVSKIKFNQEDEWTSLPPIHHNIFPTFSVWVGKPSCPLPPSTAGKQHLCPRNISAGRILRRVHDATIKHLFLSPWENATYKTRFSREAATCISRPGNECLVRVGSRWTSYGAETARFQCGIFFFFFSFLWGTNRIVTLCRNSAKTSSSNTAAVHSAVCLMRFYNPACGLMDTSGGKKKEGGRQHFPLKKLYQHGMKEKKNPKKDKYMNNGWMNPCGSQRIVYYYFFASTNTLVVQLKEKTFNNLYAFGINSILLFFLSSMGPHTKRASLVPQAARCQKRIEGLTMFI